MRRHFVSLAAFLMPAAATTVCPVIVLDVHRRRRRDAHEAVDEQGDQRPVAQPRDRRDVDRVQQLTRLVGRHLGRLAARDDVFALPSPLSGVTLPTIACPPSATWTCSTTTTRCSPGER